MSSKALTARQTSTELLLEEVRCGVWLFHCLCIHGLKQPGLLPGVLQWAPLAFWIFGWPSEAALHFTLRLDFSHMDGTSSPWWPDLICGGDKTFCLFMVSEKRRGEAVRDGQNQSVPFSRGKNPSMRALCAFNYDLSTLRRNNRAILKGWVVTQSQAFYVSWRGSCCKRKRIKRKRIKIECAAWLGCWAGACVWMRSWYLAGISLWSSCLCRECAVPGEGLWRLAEFILSEGVADLVTWT